MQKLLKVATKENKEVIIHVEEKKDHSKYHANVAVNEDHKKKEEEEELRLILSSKLEVHRDQDVMQEVLEVGANDEENLITLDEVKKD